MNGRPAAGGPGEIRRFIGLILIVIGVFWLAVSGLCSAAFLVSLFIGGGDFREALSIVPMILLVGGFSCGIGFAVIAIGRAMRPKS